MHYGYWLYGFWDGIKMKYNYKELKGKCNTCIGCNLLEREDFKGYYRCENYIKTERIKEDEQIQQQKS